MSDLKQKIKVWYEKIRAKTESYSRSGIRPIRDWHIVLTILFTLFVSVSVASLYLYTQIKESNLFIVEIDVTQTTVAIDNILLQKIVEEINERGVVANSLKQNRGIPADPSI